MEDNASARLLVGEHPPNTARCFDRARNNSFAPNKYVWGVVQAHVLLDLLQGNLFAVVLCDKPYRRHSHHPAHDLQTLCSWCSTLG